MSECALIIFFQVRKSVTLLFISIRQHVFCVSSPSSLDVYGYPPHHPQLERGRACAVAVLYIYIYTYIHIYVYIYMAYAKHAVST